MNQDNKKIIWLASYPKSGNTWFRVFLTNLLEKRDTPADINNLNSTPIASSRSIFDDECGIATSELTNEEVDNLRPAVYQFIAEKAKETCYLKIHDAYLDTPNGTRLIPAGSTKGVLYFIRNPLDVAVSFAHHTSVPIKKMIELMNNAQHAFCSRQDRIHNQLKQRLLTWSRHVLSWVENKEVPVHVVRFEDMLENPVPVFSAAVKFMELDYGLKAIKKAIELSSFNYLREQEEKQGFKEKPPTIDYFFRSGKSGDWKDRLSEQEAKKIRHDHGEVMQRFGYR
jgi:hypothetical protein